MKCWEEVVQLFTALWPETDSLMADACALEVVINLASRNEWASVVLESYCLQLTRAIEWVKVSPNWRIRDLIAALKVQFESRKNWCVSKVSSISFPTIWQNGLLRIGRIGDVTHARIPPEIQLEFLCYLSFVFLFSSFAIMAVLFALLVVCLVLLGMSFHLPLGSALFSCSNEFVF